MNHHRIRLRGPWQLTFQGQLQPQSETPKPITIQPPCNLSGFFSVPNSSILLQRKLGRPTSLSSQESVFLVIQKPTFSFTLLWNGAELSQVSPCDQFEFPIKELLKERNLLELKGVIHDPSQILFEEVFLEIRGNSVTQSPTSLP